MFDNFTRRVFTGVCEIFHYFIFIAPVVRRAMYEVI